MPSVPLSAIWDSWRFARCAFHTSTLRVCEDNRFPRQSFTYTFHLDKQQFSRAKAIANQWAHRVFGIPVWSELTRLGSLMEGATEIRFDTSFADYRENDIVLVWSSDLQFQAVETTNVLPDCIKLKLPLTTSFSNAYIAPMRFARTFEGFTFKRGPQDTTIAIAQFQVTKNVKLDNPTSAYQYRGRDVLDALPIALSDVTEKTIRQVDIFDNGSGPIVVDVKSANVRNTTPHTFDTLNRAERWKVRQWLHSRKGRQKSFWLPSWNEDLIIVEEISAITSTIIVSPIGYPLFYGVKDIAIFTTTGLIFARVLTASTNEDGNEVLTLAAPIGSQVSLSTVIRVSFMSLVRLDADSITCDHANAGRFTSTIPLVEVPE